MPTLDLDILSEDAVRALVDHVREHYEESGYILPRIGKPPKCAIPFRTEEPFKKIVVNLTAADGSEGQKIEFLADGEQVVVAGIHPDTRAALSLAAWRARTDQARRLALHPRGGGARAGRGLWSKSWSATSATNALQSGRAGLPTAPS